MSGVQGAPLAGVSKAERGRSPLCKLRVQGSAPRRNFHLKMTCFYSKFQIATGAPDIKIITPVKTTIGVMTVNVFAYPMFVVSPFRDGSGM